jgi:hypothetical protein
MPAEKLGAYVLDHDEKSFIVRKGQIKEIRYSSSGQVEVEGKESNEILERDYKQYTDFKFSFDELNFASKKEAVEKLEKLAEDISSIEINNPKKDSWNKQFRIDANFDDLNQKKQQEKVQTLVVKKYKDDERDMPEVINFERNQDGWAKEIVKVKLRRTYERTVNLDDSIISIHTKSRAEIEQKNHYKVKPHIHLIIDKNKAFGRKYSYLKQKLSQKLKKHNLTSSHNLDIKRERSSKEYKEYRILKDRLSSFSWVVSKHQDEKYIRKQLSQYQSNDKSVKLNNIEKKLNRYLELGGSYDFARKLKTNLKEKLNIEINVKVPRDYQIAEQNIKQGKYINIIKEVRNQALNGEKISERYKEYAKEVLGKDQINIKELAAAKAIKEVVKNRGYYLDQNFNKIIDKNKINRICDQKIRKINNLEKNKFYNQVRKKIKNREYTDQDKLRKDLKKAEITSLKEVAGASEVAVIFQGTEKKIRNKLSKDKYLTAAEIKKEINSMNLDISDKWKDKILEKIYKEQAPLAAKEKEIKEIDRKLKNLKEKRAATRTNLARLSSTCRRIGFQLDNLTGAQGEDELLEEINKSSEKLKAGINILLELMKYQAAAGSFKRVKKIAGEEEKNLEGWNENFKREIKNMEKIEAAAKEYNVEFKEIEKLKKGYKLTFNSGKDLKFIIEDSEKTLKAHHVKNGMMEKIKKVDKERKILRENGADKSVSQLKSEIESLKKERENVSSGGLLGKITGRAKKAEKKRNKIDEKIKNAKDRLGKIKTLEKNREKYSYYVLTAREQLKKLKNKTKEKKVKSIKKERDRYLKR